MPTVPRRAAHWRAGGGQDARALHAPLDLLLVLKIGAPQQPELAVAGVVESTPPALVCDEGICAATVIVVDDGVATGTTVRAALRGLRSQRVGRVVLALPR